jgi:hypothetical protein
VSPGIEFGPFIGQTPGRPTSHPASPDHDQADPHWIGQATARIRPTRFDQGADVASDARCGLTMTQVPQTTARAISEATPRPHAQRDRIQVSAMAGVRGARGAKQRGQDPGEADQGPEPIAHLGIIGRPGAYRRTSNRKAGGRDRDPGEAPQSGSTGPVRLSPTTPGCAPRPPRRPDRDRTVEDADPPRDSSRAIMTRPPARRPRPGPKPSRAYRRTPPAAAGAHVRLPRRGEPIFRHSHPRSTPMRG